MPQSYIEYTNGLSDTTFSVPFKYISVDDVHALGYDGTNYFSLTVASRDASAKTITLDAAPSAYTKVRVYRATATTQLVDFQNGSRLSEADLDTAYQQGLFVAQEVSEDANTKQYTDLTDQALLAANTSLSEFSSSSHTGDASEVTFDLSFVPKTETPQAFLVIIDGVLQSPVDAYTISIAPAQITFASAPPASSKIVVTTTAAATGTLVEDTDLQAGVNISIDPPADPKVGELWFDSSVMTMFAYYDDGQGNPQWVSISSSVANNTEGQDNNTIELNNTNKLQVKDGGITPSKLSTGAPNWDATGTLTVTNELNVGDEINLQGAADTDSLLQQNASSGRDELQIYASVDAYSSGSKGSGIHLYGNGDSEHSGGIAFLTGQDDQGDARMIISGGSRLPSSNGYRTNTDTRVTIGNDIFNYVDDEDDKALLTLKNPIGRPALYIEGASAAEGDIAIPVGEKLSIGVWDGTTFTPRIEVDSSGNFIISSIATSPTGLPSGAVYSDGGTLKIV